MTTPITSAKPKKPINTIVRALAAHHDAQRLTPCGDGPNCLWCPAETILDALQADGWIPPTPAA